jgi:4-hydroxy-3-methylbut-2-enyl diphosphate reductase
VADGSELKREWFTAESKIGLTAGASAPEVLVDDVIDTLRCFGPVELSILDGTEENVSFRIPRELAEA